MYLQTRPIPSFYKFLSSLILIQLYEIALARLHALMSWILICDVVRFYFALTWHMTKITFINSIAIITNNRLFGKDCQSIYDTASMLKNMKSFMNCRNILLPDLQLHHRLTGLLHLFGPLCQRFGTALFWHLNTFWTMRKPFSWHETQGLLPG